MRCAIIKKGSLDKIQNQKQQQTLIAFKTLCPLKKLNNKVKIASDTAETKQTYSILFEKVWDQTIIRLGNR